MWAWSMSPSKYVQAVKICKEYVAKHLSKGYRLQKRANNPFESGYSPKQDVFPVLGPGEASYYLTLIGIMRWMNEIGKSILILRYPNYHQTQQYQDRGIWKQHYIS